MTAISGYSYNPQVEGGLKAGSDYSSANNYLLMKIDTSADDQLLTAGAGEECVGIRINKPGSGEAVELAIGGVAPLKLGGTVTRGGQVKSDASGQGVAASSDKDKAFGQALRSGVSGDIIPILIKPIHLGV
jgi:hypothetical protein